MKRLFALLIPLVALTGCATYGDGYYRDRTVYRDGGYYYPAYEGAGDYYYGADQGYDYDYHYGSGIGYGYGYSPFWGLDRYRCRSYYGCVPAWGGYYPYHYSPGWSFSVGNTWGWGNLGWYGGYRWNNHHYPRYRPRPDYGRNEPRPMPKPTGRTPTSQSTPYYRPGQPIRRPVVEGERVRNPDYRSQAQPARVEPGYARPVSKPVERFERSPRPYTKPARAAEEQPQPSIRYRPQVPGEPLSAPRQRASMPVQPAPARSGGPRTRYPEPVRSQSRQAVGQPVRSAPQARPAPMPRAQPMQRAQPVAKPAPRQAAPRPALRQQVRTTSQNGTSSDEE